MKDLYRQLKSYGIPTDAVYNIKGCDSIKDYIEESDLGFYDSSRFYREDGRSVRKGGSYTPSRFDDWAA